MAAPSHQEGWVAHALRLVAATSEAFAALSVAARSCRIRWALRFVVNNKEIGT